MSIIIPSKHIFNINNDVVIKNNVKQVSIPESTYNINSMQLYYEAAISPDTLHTQTYYSEWIPTGGLEEYRRWELQCTYVQYTYSVSSKNALIYDTLSTQLSLTSTGNVAGNFNNEKLTLRRAELDYNIISIPSPPPATNDVNLIGKFCNQQIKEKATYTLEFSDQYNFKITLKYLNKITVHMIEEVRYLGNPTETYRYATSFNPEITNASVETSANYSTVQSNVRRVGIGGFEVSLEGNELLQDTTFIDNIKIGDYLSEIILKNYKNGKETAVIRCSVPEDLSVFEIGDEVIPMVFGADGKDHPMSRYKDGTPKVFNVVGTKFIYDGAVWQELTLQEKTQSV